MPAKISIKNLVKNFGTKEVLKGINLEVKEGESIVIIGGSGSGKTVLMQIMAGILKPTSGKVIVDNIDIGSFKTEKEEEQYIKKISFLFQLNALFDAYPVWKNIMLGPIENEYLPKSKAIALAKKKLIEVDLKPEVAFNFPKDISGGMQKRVALARCLVSAPEIIFFDEPTSGLDPLTSVIVSNLIKNTKSENKNKITKFSIMHDMECAKIVADRVVLLMEGKIEWQGKVEEMENSSNKNLQQFIKKASF
jgi:phospholipid/cholesterol/gamma-HCH transport system ATP-binding protein